MTFTDAPLVIFDCDGVLVDTESISAESLSLYLQNLGIEQAAEVLAGHYTARAFNYIENDLREKYGQVIRPDFEKDYRTFVYGRYRQKLKAIDGIAQAIEALSLNIKCVASNAPREKIDLVLEITDLAKYFSKQAIFTAYEVGSWKPNPGLFLAAAESMNFTPDRCVVVEDSAIGATAALAADMNCLLYRPKTKVEGTIGFQSMSELPGLVARL